MSRVSTVASSEVSFSNNSDDFEAVPNQVYAMKSSSIIKEEMEDEQALTGNDMYSVQPDRIPGYEQFTKKRILRNLGSKALAGLAAMRNKENKDSVSQVNQVSKYLQYSEEMDVLESDHKYNETDLRSNGSDSFQTNSVLLKQPVNMNEFNTTEYASLIDAPPNQNFINIKENERLLYNSRINKSSNLMGTDSKCDKSMGCSPTDINKTSVPMEMKATNNMIPNNNPKINFYAGAFVNRSHNLYKVRKSSY